MWFLLCVLLYFGLITQKLAKNIFLVSKLSAFYWFLLVTHIFINCQHILQEIMEVVIGLWGLLNWLWGLVIHFSLLLRFVIARFIVIGLRRWIIGWIWMHRVHGILIHWRIAHMHRHHAVFHVRLYVTIIHKFSVFVDIFIALEHFFSMCEVTAFQYCLLVQ